MGEEAGAASASSGATPKRGGPGRATVPDQASDIAEQVRRATRRRIECAAAETHEHAVSTARERHGARRGRILTMGKVLQQALAELTKLPETEQDAVGAWILAELESERRWDELFARSPDLLAEMADDAIREDEAGLTEPLDPEKLL